MIKEDSWGWMKMVMINIDENYPIWQANEAKIKIPKNPERFPWNPGIKNIGKSRPEKSRDPGIWQNPVPKNPGIEILDPARACSWVVHCCIPVSLLIGGWDWVQGGNPLYAAVKCLSDRRGQIWRIFFNFFAKSTCHIHFPGGIFFGGSKKNFYPLKWAIL